MELEFNNWREMMKFLEYLKNINEELLYEFIRFTIIPSRSYVCSYMCDFIDIEMMASMLYGAWINEGKNNFHTRNYETLETYREHYEKCFEMNAE